MGTLGGRGAAIIAAAVVTIVLGTAEAQASVGWQTSATGTRTDGTPPPTVTITPQGDTLVFGRSLDGLRLVVHPAAGDTTSTLIDHDGIDPVLASDAAGDAVLAWRDSAGHVRSRTRAPGGTLSATSDLGPSDGYLALAVNPAGAAVLAWHRNGVPDPASGQFVAARRPAGGPWGAPVALSATGPTPDTGISAAIAPSGRAYFGWEAFRIGTLMGSYVATWPLGGAPAAPQESDTPGPVQVGAGPDGRGIAVRLSGTVADYATAGADGHFGAWTQLATDVGDADLAVGPGGQALVVLDQVRSDDATKAAGVSVSLGSVDAALPAPAQIAGAPSTAGRGAFAPDGSALVTLSDGSGAPGFRDGSVLATVAAPGGVFEPLADVMCARPWGLPVAAAGGTSGRWAVLWTYGTEHGPVEDVTLSTGTSGATGPSCPPVHYGVDAPALVAIGAPAHFSVASMLDPGETPAAVQWAFAGPSGQQTASTAGSELDTSFPVRGRYTAHAVVQHDAAHGNWSDSRETSFLVDDPPAVTVSPASTQVSTGSSVTFTVGARAVPGGSIASQTFTVGGPAQGATTQPASGGRFTVHFAKPGTYPVTATATDDLGLQGSATATVVVTDHGAGHGDAAGTSGQGAGGSSCLHAAVPTRAKRSTTLRRGIAVRLRTDASTCRVSIRVARGSHTVALKKLTLRRASHSHTVRVKLGPSTRRALRARSRSRLSVTVSAVGRTVRRHVTVVR